MSNYRIAYLAITLVERPHVPQSSSAQSANNAFQHTPLQKTIGHATPEVVPSLVVFNASEASLQGGKLVLRGVAPNSIVFADRPVRVAGHDLTKHIVEDWAAGSDSFAKDPPNATVSAFTKDGSGIKDVVAVLKTPKLDGDRLTFDVEAFEGDLKGADESAAVFIDITGRPLTPLSYAGAARRTARRGAYYAGVAAAAGAAAAHYHPYYRPSCGYCSHSPYY